MKENASLRYYVNFFEGKWDKSLDRRIEACEAYAHAINNFGPDAKAQFKDSYQQQNFKENQWRVIYLVGSDVLAPEWLDYRNYSIPLSLVANKVNMDTQYDIYENGIDLYTIDGNTRHVDAKALRVKDINQLFKENGEQRTMEEQIQWLEDRQHPNINVMEDGSLHVHHRCYINKVKQRSLIMEVFSSTELYEMANIKNSRGQ